jgi:NADPH:quinone reductase-like Zn-dependent oxidoreductase
MSTPILTTKLYTPLLGPNSSLVPAIAWPFLRLFMGLKRKEIPGHEFAGEIEATGKDVTRFSKGDQVFGTTTGLSVGANAEYVCLPEEWATGVCSAANIEMVKSLGADQVIDYTKEDFTQNGQTYDIIFDAVGKTSHSQCKGSLTEDGVFVSVQSSTHESRGNLAFLKELVEAGELKPVVDRRYPLEQVAEAHRYVEAGHKKGNVVITVEHV